jgi:hypothetical protein
MLLSLSFDQVSWIVVGVVFSWLAGLTWFSYRTFAHYRRLTGGVAKKDLKSVLEKLLKDAEGEGKRIDELVKRLEGVEKEGLSHIQKLGLVRFNPFAETGGDQSFTLALLDGEDNGFVVSSLHSRDSTRLYAKPVRKGKASGYELSTEEERAIKRAKKMK